MSVLSALLTATVSLHVDGGLEMKIKKASLDLRKENVQTTKTITVWCKV